MAPSMLEWISNVSVNTARRNAWEGVDGWYRIIEESWIPQGFGYAFGPPKGTDTFSSKLLVGVYINKSGKSSVMGYKTPNLSQPFRTYWNLEHLLGTRENRVKGLMSHALAVLVHVVTRSVRSTKVLASNKPPHVPERFADWNKLGSVTMMVDKKTPNLLKRERGEEDSKSTDEFLEPETKCPRKKKLWLTLLVSIPKGTNKRKRN